MGLVIWKVPDRWRAPTLVQRASLYPALYLRDAGFETRIRRTLVRRDFQEAQHIVLVSDAALDGAERDLLSALGRTGISVLALPLNGWGPEEVEFATRERIVIASEFDEGPHASGIARPREANVIGVRGCSAREPEDTLIAEEFGTQWLPAPPPAHLAAASRIVVAAEDNAALAEIAPALRQHLARTPSKLVILADHPTELTVDALDLPDYVVLDSRTPNLLSLIPGTFALMCAYPRARPGSGAPGGWVRTALHHGVPVIAASHPSIDGLAHLCILDDWERGLAVYGKVPASRAKVLADAEAFLGERLEPLAIAAQWRKALKAAALTKSGVESGRGRRRPPVVLALFDLSQDADVMLPVLLALRDRGVVRLNVVVTDWLEQESPRTLQLLAANGFTFELLSRTSVRTGEAPDLAGVDAVFAATETSAGPHRAGHRLAERARSAGIPAFTLQHGFENIGLTYRDDVHEDIRFSSDVIFTWGPPEGLAGWVPSKTRNRTVGVGSPKRTPPPSAAVRIKDRERWSGIVAVFENLHWHRFDDDYRCAFLEHLSDSARNRTDMLFLVKPHHAGRWLVKNPDRLAQSPNLKLLDPTDPAWQPYTAPALIASADMIITTPSTVAMDAARGGRPVAVTGYGLDLSAYAPLPVLRSQTDWSDFIEGPADDLLTRNEEFLQRVLIPGRADQRIAARIEDKIRKQQRQAVAARPSSGELAKPAT